MLLLALANSPIRRLAMNSSIMKSRIIWSSERPLSSCKQQLCLFACSTSLPAPPLAISTWYPQKRDQPNNASCCCQGGYVLRIPPKNMNHNAEFSQEQQSTYYSYIGSRFLIILLNNKSINIDLLPRLGPRFPPHSTYMIRARTKKTKKKHGALDTQQPRTPRSSSLCRHASDSSTATLSVLSVSGRSVGLRDMGWARRLS